MTDKILAAADILGADDLKREVVPVPAWGGSVIVRTMTGAQRDAWEAQVTQRKGKDDQFDTLGLKATLLSFALVGEDGKTLFAPSQVAALNEKHSGILDLLFRKVQELNALTAESFGELEKN